MAKKKENRDYGRIIRNLIFFVGICFFTYLLLKYKLSPTESKNPITEQFILQRTYDNYHVEIDSIAKNFDINPSYLLALTVLECSGRKEFEPRFEQHVFDQLKKVRDKSGTFGSITHSTISDASDNALRNLATSWGPFQLMGYQCIELDVNVQDIRGKHSIYWGTYWIYKRYSKYLKKGDYANAFHIHNTGKKIPLSQIHKTHDPTYVERGLGYISHFDKKLNK